MFFWGLGYKLSLYDFHRASIHRIPDAKLLSRNEDPNATDSTRLCLVNSSTDGTGFRFHILDPDRFTGYRGEAEIVF